MKKTLFYLLLCGLSLFIMSCQQRQENRWKIELKKVEAVKITDISAEFYNDKIPFEDFKKKYAFFLSPQVADAVYEKKRGNALEKRIYKDALSKNQIPALEKELAQLFARIKFYFPRFQNPRVYAFSSATELYDEPILYLPEQKLLFIDISAFLGEKSEFYEGIDAYLRKEMNPQNLMAKTSETIAQDYVPVTPDQNKYLDKMVNSGKMLILQDAFLPQVTDHYKIGYSTQQQSWAISNEENIWNYFVENDLLFSDDHRLDERFLSKAPFSKFYTEIDQKSSPKVGAFIGWQICRAYLEKNPDVTLPKFLQLPATEIFNNSNYKPKN